MFLSVGVLVCLCVGGCSCVCTMRAEIVAYMIYLEGLNIPTM